MHKSFARALLFLPVWNPNRIEPRVNLAAETRVKQYNIQLLFRGPIDQLRTTYSSEPPLPPINLLVFGRTTRTTDATTPSNLGAESLIASTVTRIITNRVEKLVGL